MGKGLKRTMGALAVCGLLVGTMATVTSTASAGTAKELATGKATGLADVNGNISATVPATGKDGSAATIDMTGVLAPGSGIGKKTAKTTGTTDDQGHFQASFKGKKSVMTGTVSGSISQPGGGPPAPSNFSISINCTVSYPPLTINCTITIGWSAA